MPVFNRMRQKHFNTVTKKDGSCIYLYGEVMTKKNQSSLFLFTDMADRQWGTLIGTQNSDNLSLL